MDTVDSQYFSYMEDIKEGGSMPVFRWNPFIRLFSAYNKTEKHKARQVCNPLGFALFQIFFRDIIFFVYITVPDGISQ